MSEAAKESKVKEPLTKEEKIRRILLITLSSIVAIVIIVGLFVGSPYSIEKNEYKSFEGRVLLSSDGRVRFQTGLQKL